MPITYEIIPEEGLIQTSPTGILTFQETMDYFSALFRSDWVMPNAIEVFDFSGVTGFEITYLNANRLASFFQVPKEEKCIHATIYLCNNDTAFGMGRMLHTLHHLTNPKHVVRLARTQKELKSTIKQLKPKPSAKTKQTLLQ